nr:family 43 glycosylhydrolase [Bacteroidales bacterium]
MKRIYILVFALLAVACTEKIIDERPIKTGDVGFNKVYYTNPVIRNNCADPDVFDDRERTGYYYAYSTQNGTPFIPVYRSTDLINWTLMGDAFDGDQPDWQGEGARCWAPNVKYINGKYVMYFALGNFVDASYSGTGVAYSTSPTGPFLWRDLPNHGYLIGTKNTGLSNMIDPAYVQDVNTGTPYLFVGSFGSQCLWAMELAPDGLSFVKDCSVEANRTKYAKGIEGTYVHYH